MTRFPDEVDGVAWRPGHADDVAELTEIMAAADAVDDPGHMQGVSGTEDLLRVLDPAEAIVIGTRDGTPVAASIVWRPGDGPVRLRGGVAPAARGRGIGRVLLRFQLARAAELHPDAGLAGVRSVDGRGPAAVARRFGFHEARTFLTMRRSLLGGPAVLPLPADLRAVPFDPGLDEATRVAKNAAFHDHWQGVADGPEQWRTRMLGPHLDRALSRIAVDAQGDVAGFVLVQRVPEQPDDAYVPLVGTARAHRGRGVARALLTAALAAAAQEGLLETTLEVDADSPTGAVGVYGAVGYRTVERATVWQHSL
ncbi:GNAT family N-acetyltransferase [Amnibacterium kyonggiense]|uniref:Mycothiol synthase n=1 Tax=Amnibacterium kyonggiense TaxID=595671 RepID=A0A4R7FR35_9MICO|nr:GNAT family N-acetyltransferase [Amnibacterium kyonggiense]TDS80158.1 mycothiol synthase [Amnibacterium kyonggiense]